MSKTNATPSKTAAPAEHNAETLLMGRPLAEVVRLLSQQDRQTVRPGAQ